MDELSWGMNTNEAGGGQNWKTAPKISAPAPGVRIQYNPLPWSVSKNCEYDGISFPWLGH